MKIYHFTKKENVDGVMLNGLQTKSNYKGVGSRIRNEVIYGWLKPEYDLMGYKNNDNYALLEIDVELDSCIIANMDWISSAYVNDKVYGESKNKLVTHLITMYNNYIPLKKYLLGTYRAPEVLINTKISPDKIRILNNDIAGINDNVERYNDIIAVKYNFKISDEIFMRFLNETNFEMIAIHDDSSGLLMTMFDELQNEVVTLNINKNKAENFMKEFFVK